MRALFVFVSLAAAACTLQPPIGPGNGARSLTLYVVNHGWHTGLVIRASDIPPTVWPERADFPEANFLEVGWGDREYYPAADPGIGAALKAGFVGGPGVLHIVGLRDTPQREFPRSEVVALPVSPQALARLGAHIEASYERDTGGRVVRLGPGLYGNSRFYGSRERFDLFNTCNVWTARALRTAGVPVAPAIRASSLMKEVRSAAETLAPATGCARRASSAPPGTAAR